MAKHEISVSFRSQPEQKPGKLAVVLRVQVGSYFEDSPFECPVPMDMSASEPQKFGAAMSFVKRYALCAALNIVICDEDNDAQNVVSTISAIQMVELEALIAETKTDLTKFLAWVNVESLDLMPKEAFKKAREFLLKKKGQAK